MTSNTILETFEAARATKIKQVRNPALTDAIEQAVLDVAPGTVIRRDVELVPGFSVRPELVVEGKLAVWVASHRTSEIWKGIDRDALVLKTSRKSEKLTSLAVIYDAAVADGNRAAVSAVRAERKCVSGVRIFSVRDDRQMADFIKQVRKALA